MEAPKLAYFDHNILSDLTDLPEEALDRIFEGFKVQGMIPVYSDETLQEVAKSANRIELMLDLLTNYSFQHLFEEIVEFKPTDRVLLAANMEPRVRFNQLLESNEEYPDEPAGFEFVRKLFGGPIDESYFDLIVQGMEKAEADAREAMADMGLSLTDDQRRAIEKTLAQLPEAREQLEKQKSDLDKASSSDNSTAYDIREQLGIEKGGLNHIVGEDIIERIWEEIGPAIGAPDRTKEDFFDEDINKLQDGYRFSRSIPTSVSSVYQQLNIIGYWKDEKMHRESRFNAAQSDGKHVGMAAMCSVFFCNDDRCCKKARAAFQFVDSKCSIVSLDIKQSDKENESS